MSAPSTCTLSGKVYESGALATTVYLVRIRIAGADGLSALVTGTQTGDGQSIGNAASVYTANGLWSIVLPQGVAFRIEIPGAGLDAVGAVPASSSADLSNLTLEDYVTWSRRNPGSVL